MAKVSTKEESLQLQTELTDLASGEFNLLICKSNFKEVLKHLPQYLNKLDHILTISK